jgi:hypothetical protein
MGGLITWGGIDNDGTRCYPSINYVPVSSKTYWQFTLTNFIFGFYASNKNQQAISSTENALLGFPSTAINEMMKVINGSYHSNTGNYYASCNASFPSMRYVVGGQNYDVPWKSYVINVRLNPLAELFLNFLHRNVEFLKTEIEKSQNRAFENRTAKKETDW